MGLDVDATARCLLAQGHCAQGVLITLAGNYGMPGAALVVEWRPLEQVVHDPDLVLLEVIAGVPVYTLQRIATYARWRPFRLITRGPRFWPRLAIDRATVIRRDMLHWEHVHAGMHDTLVGSLTVHRRA